MAKRRRYPRVEVVWEDITGHGPNWHSRQDAKDATVATVEQTGYLISRTKKAIKLTDSLVDDGDFGGITVIPMGVVISITRTVLSTKMYKKD